LLLGGLWMTQQLGVAGGKLAAAASNKIQRAGTIIAKAPFKAARGLATLGERKIYSATGIGLNPMRAIKAWQSYSGRKRLEEEAIGTWRAGTKAEGKFAEGKGRRGMLRLALGAHEDFYQNYLGWRGIKRGLKTALGPSRMGKEAYEEMEEAKKKSKLNLALATAWKNKDFTKTAEEHIRKTEREEEIKERTKEVGDRRTALIINLEKQGKSKTDLEASKKQVQEELKKLEHKHTTDRVTDGYRTKEDTRIKIDNEYEAQKQKLVQDLNTVDTSLNDIEKYLTRETMVVKSDGKKTRAQQTFDQALESHFKDVDIVFEDLKAPLGTKQQERADKEKANFAENWDKSKASEEAYKDASFEAELEQRVKNKVEKVKQDEGLEAYGKRVLSEQSQKLKADFDYVNGGGLTPVQAQQRDKEIAYLLRQIADTEREIANRKAEGKRPEDYANLIKAKEEAQKKHDLISKKETIDGVERYKPSDEEKKINREKNKDDIMVAELEWNKSRGALLDEEQYKKAETNKTIYDKQAEKYQESPRAFYASRSYRALEAQESSKLPHHSMEWDEIDNLLKTAIKDKDIVRVSSLMKKATQDYNDNEIWNAYGYGSGPEGAEKFRQDILEKKVGMNSQASMALMNDINYMNEDLGHNNTSRMYGVKGGAFYLKDAEDQAASVATENLKQNSRNFIQSRNRLAYGYEDADKNYHLDLSGRLTLVGFQNDFAYRLGRAEVNPSFLSKLTTILPEIEQMERDGILTAKTDDQESISQAVKRIAEEQVKRGVNNTFVGLMSTARRFKSGV